MAHGKHSAWPHVVVAYVIECLVFCVIPVAVLQVAFESAFGHSRDSDTVATVLGLLAGAVLAWRVFRDRWRCIEAFSSRFCSGLFNLSVLYVPFIALAYANVRGLEKYRLARRQPDAGRT
jgi:hypothetical protein